MSNSNIEQPERTVSRRQPWLWIPSLYFAEGIPYVVVMTVAVIMYKKLGVSNTDIALYTSWLYLPWVIKPFWSPLVDVLKTKRWWIVAMQLLIGAGMAGVALTIPTSNFLQYSLAFLWLLAFSSATHDIAADGFYMLGLTSHEQTWFVGIRSTFYRLAMISGQGLLVMFAGALEEYHGLPEVAVRIEASAKESIEYRFDPSRFVVAADSSEQQILVEREHYQLSLEKRSPEQVNSLIEEVRNWNVKNGFYELEESQAREQKEKPAWLQRLEEWIEEWFGQDSQASRPVNVAGDIAIIQMRLSRPLRETESRVVHFSLSRGDTSFQVVEGTRYTLSAENCTQPFVAVVQIDPRLNHPSEARFCALSGNSPLVWKHTFLLLTGFFLVICLYHLLALPRPSDDTPSETIGIRQALHGFLVPFQSFFRKKGIILAIAFLLFYRFSEAQLVKLASPFLLDDKNIGGLALSTGAVGFVYGTVGIVMLTIGGILGGLFAARQGLKFWLWWMVLAINLPNVVYVFLSQLQPDNYLIVNLAVAVEQFGYGFGFTAYMLFMLYMSQGEHETAHYAICTGLMALGMMLPGMVSGWLQDLIGYQNFFIWVMIATIPSFAVCWFVSIDAEFGKDAHRGETP